MKYLTISGSDKIGYVLRLERRDWRFESFLPDKCSVHLVWSRMSPFHGGHTGSNPVPSTGLWYAVSPSTLLAARSRGVQGLILGRGITVITLDFDSSNGSSILSVLTMSYKIKSIEDFKEKLNFKAVRGDWGKYRNQEYPVTWFCPENLIIHSNLKEKLHCSSCCELNEEDKQKCLKMLK